MKWVARIPLLLCLNRRVAGAQIIFWLAWAIGAHASRVVTVNEYISGISHVFGIYAVMGIYVTCVVRDEQDPEKIVDKVVEKTTLNRQ